MEKHNIDQQEIQNATSFLNESRAILLSGKRLNMGALAKIYNVKHYNKASVVTQELGFFKATGRGSSGKWSIVADHTFEPIHGRRLIEKLKHEVYVHNSKRNKIKKENLEIKQVNQIIEIPKVMDEITKIRRDFDCKIAEMERELSKLKYEQDCKPLKYVMVMQFQSPIKILFRNPIRIIKRLA